MTYAEKSVQVARSATVAVQILLGDAPGDCEFIPLRPKMASEAMLADLKARWPGRGLRSVGVIGLCGTTPQAAFKEPLESEQVSALAAAFLTYLHVMFADSFAAQMQAAEIQEIERLMLLPDTRIN